MIIGKAAEQLFGISCYQLVVEKGFTNQEEFPEAILQVRGQYRLFQLRFGAIKNDLNRSDLLIQAVFDDIEELLESSSSPSNQALVQYEKKDTPGQIFPSTSPPLSKETSTPLTASSTSSPNEPMSASKEKARIAVKKRLFSSLIQTQKKFKTDDTTKEKTDMIHAANALQKDVSDSDMPRLSLSKPRLHQAMWESLPQKRKLKSLLRKSSISQLCNKASNSLISFEQTSKRKKSPSTKQ
ncbi:hypothetical protein ACE6H2_006798 [Prunus campanulata]